MPPVEPVLGHLPSESMGFLVVNSIQKLSDDVDAFVQAMNMPGMAGGPNLIAGLQMGAGLGEEFNPNGGFAIVMLDFETFGVDPSRLKLMPDMPMGFADEDPATASAEAKEPLGPADLPIVAFVPGKSIEGVFGNHPMTQDGDQVQVEFEGQTLFAATKGGYVVLSTRADALAAALAAQPLAANQQAKLAGSDVAVHVDMARCSPIVQDMMQQFADVFEHMPTTAPAGAPAPPEEMQQQMQRMMKGYVGFADYLLDQVEAITMHVDIGEKGIHLGQTVAFVPDSTMGKIMAAQTGPSGESLLDRLPSLPYVAAFGAAFTQTDEINTLTQKVNEMFFSALDLDQELTEKLLAQANRFNDEVELRGTQFVIGGTPEAAPGALGVSIVYLCDNAAAMQGLMAEQVEFQTEFLNALSDETEVEAQWTITYEPGAATVAGVSADRMRIGLPGTEDIEEFGEVMTDVLGSEQIEVLVAPADAQTLVVTVGGGEAMLAEALTVADGSGPIAADPAVADALSAVPDDAWCVGVFSLTNVKDVATDLMAAVGEPEQADMFPLKYMTVQTPVVFYMASDEAALNLGLTVPAAMIGDAMQSSMQVMMEAMQQQMEAEEGMDGPADEEYDEGAPESDTEEEGF